MILQYLPLYQVFQARRVSRAWRDILTSPSILDSLLSSWDSGSNSHLGIPEGSSAAATASLKAEHIDAFLSGRPFSVKSYGLSGLPRSSSHQRIAYSDGAFAWIDPNDERICQVLDLRSGKEISFMAEERCTMGTIAISTSMVAATSAWGKLVVWTRDEQRSMSFSMPSARIEKLLLSKETLVVLFSPELLDSGAYIQVLTWKLIDQNSRSFTLRLQVQKLRGWPEPGDLYRIKAMLDNEGGSLLLFERNLDISDSGEQSFHSTRTSLTGEVLAQSSLQGSDLDQQWDDSCWFCPVQARNIASVWSTAKHNTDSSASAETQIRRVCYDFDKNCLKLDTHFVDAPCTYNNSSLLFWDDVAYLWDFTDSDDHVLSVIDFRTSTCTTAPVVNPGRRPSTCFNSWTFGDGIFHVRLFTTAIWVMCFDKHVEMGV